MRQLRDGNIILGSLRLPRQVCFRLVPRRCYSSRMRRLVCLGAIMVREQTSAAVAVEQLRPI